jgi:hypothetical protein
MTMTMRRLLPKSTLTLLPVLALALGLTACGGGVSKSAYVKKAVGACGPGNATVAATATPSNLPELSAAAGKIATTVDDQSASLRKLSAPGSDKAVVAGVIGALADVGGPAHALQAAAGKTDDGTTAQAVTDLKAKVDAAAATAQSYGLTACAKGLQPTTQAVFDGGKTIMKAAFVARADTLCTAANKKADALANPTSLATTVKFLTAYIPLEDKLFADIKALVKPPGDEATVSDMLAAQDTVIAKDKEALAAAQKGNTNLFFSLSDEEGTLVTASNAKFDAYGLRSCGTLSSF